MNCLLALIFHAIDVRCVELVDRGAILLQLLHHRLDLLLGTLLQFVVLFLADCEQLDRVIKLLLQLLNALLLLIHQLLILLDVVLHELDLHS